MLDFYFKKPLLWDYIIAILIATIFYYLGCIGQINMPKEDQLLSIVSDLSTISLTLAGFVLTLLTVLISFKSSAKEPSDLTVQTKTVFELFFFSQLYFSTVKHLKNAILSFTLVSILGYILKLTIQSSSFAILFAYDILGLILIFFTLWRCLFILNGIIKLQKMK